MTIAPPYRYHHRVISQARRAKRGGPTGDQLRGRKTWGKTSHYRGVYQVATVGGQVRWVAKIRVNKSLHYIGTYDHAIVAARAYDVRARALLGSRAVCNFDELEIII